MDKEMRRALEKDGEMLRAMTGEEHGPYFIETQPGAPNFDGAAAYELFGHLNEVEHLRAEIEDERASHKVTMRELLEARDEIARLRAALGAR